MTPPTGTYKLWDRLQLNHTTLAQIPSIYQGRILGKVLPQMKSERGQEIYSSTLGDKVDLTQDLNWWQQKGNTVS